MRTTSILVAAALVCMAACTPHDQPASANENAVPPVSEPTLDGAAPVTIAPGADTMYPVTPDSPPPVVTPEQGAPQGATP